ncbi:hypothetical protein quinque_012576 [Culex quinquefasciatus]|uniref:mite group 2 allergen Lep d 2-like n=1 Tax=Culex pipiens pallens TaxID=42434 RepID=UPI001953D7F2|nr:mite group 2 allergen Lep d 2-like [Culex pipiens pallens]
MLKFILAAVLIPVLSVTSSTPFRSCPGSAPVPQDFNIQGCTALPCTLYRGQPLTAEARGIVSQVSTNSVEAYINVFLQEIDLEYPITPEFVDACARGIRSCPLVAGQRFDYVFEKTSLDIQLNGIAVLIRVGLRYQAMPVACVEFDAIIF